MVGFNDIVYVECPLTRLAYQILKHDIDNKRFTMRDIGKLEKRIERLEYFTSLNILEKETQRYNFR